ncbi:glycoside hydrolase/phage tail family protein [Rhizobium sp. 18055]|uniref:baseplate multidomain protein megatron n=1 Tax=Rhizobium sp. 18055 TaxID=2681403 RepID=UPI00135A40FA|nr:glycoside hydrolase/phage tail family protein [Rhizobium sp. 18055]
MATLLFQAAGAALGSVFGPVGAIIGRAAGALAGSVVDHALINGSSTVRGAHLSTARIPGADEGTAINRVYGAVRIGGTLIWATRFEEEVTTERTGGKASGGTRVETFRYFANLAVGLSEGPIGHVRRVWADGKELDLTKIEMRVYRGDAAQLPDPLIEAKQGAGNAPAYRGLAYVVFERLPLDAYGNRIPLLQFEVVRSVGGLESQIRAVCIIPGATEHGYQLAQVSESTGAGSARILNRNSLQGASDWDISLDELTALCPNLERVALVVSWFGTDLRAGECRVVPGVEVTSRSDESRPWSVSGVERGAAHLVSRTNGGPAYGGTPDDASVLSAIADLKARGLQVYLYPFLMMDIPANNALPDPYGGGQQPAYPWRGRITGHPATGQPGTADRTATARSQLLAFAGNAQPSHFSVTADRVAYLGSERSYRRFILHYAQLARAAGGVDGFLIGSELRGLTQLRDGSDAFPFVEMLIALAADVRALLPQAKITYGADWSEYFGYHPTDGSGDVYYHLDPLWASPDIAAVGIDNYMPLADWRDQDLASAGPDGFRLADDRDAMIAAINAGEGFDWYYADAAARRARQRSPITDGLAGKPWVYRYKDIGSWWANPHFERVDGAERTVPTAWVPSGKPVWFTELGCGAVDKGANQPNVFADPKSVESGAPYFSNSMRSDSMQRRFLEAHHHWWAGGAAPAGMVDPTHLFVWSWDARPYPAFPLATDLWSDGNNWRTGHWLNGRLGGGTLADVIAAILRDHGFADFDVEEVSGDLTGYVQGDLNSARSLIEPLLQAFQIDALEDAGLLRFRSRARASLPALEVDILVDREDEPLWQETRGHDSDFAAEAVLTFYNPALDYEQASVRSHRVAQTTSRVIRQDLAAVVAEEAALAAAEALLRDNRIARRSIRFSLPPGELAVQPGDVVSIAEGPAGRFLISRIEDGDARRIEAREFAPSAGGSLRAATDGRDGGGTASNLFAPVVHLLDLPRFDGSEAASFARAAVFAKPWRTVGLSSSATTEGYRGRVLLDRPATIGTLAAALGSGVTGRFDWSQPLVVNLAYGELSSAAEISVLNGANRIAVRATNGVWEVLSFLQADEIESGRWRLGGLLRALAGTEDAMASGAVSGAAAVLLDEAVKPLGLGSDEMGLALNWIAEASGSLEMAGPFVFEGGMRAETPLSPVHLRCARAPSGDAVITWTRRGRDNADSWIGADIPLDEPFERYRVDVLDGDSVVRTAEVDRPEWTYASADQAQDFGGQQSSLTVRIRQIGERVPLGLPAAATFQL